MHIKKARFLCLISTFQYLMLFIVILSIDQFYNAGQRRKSISNSMLSTSHLLNLLHPNISDCMSFLAERITIIDEVVGLCVTRR